MYSGVKACESIETIETPEQSGAALLTAQLNPENAPGFIIPRSGKRIYIDHDSSRAINHALIGDKRSALTS